MLSDQLVQPADPGQPLRQPLPRQQPARVVFDLEIVMGLSPVITDEQHPASSLVDQQSTSQREDLLRPNGSVLTARHPTSTTGPLTTCRGTI